MGDLTLSAVQETLTLSASNSLTLSAVAETLTLEVSGETLTLDVAAATLTLLADAETLTLSAVEESLTLESGAGGEANTASNIGTGDGEIFSAKNGVDLELRTIGDTATVDVETSGNEVISHAIGLRVTGPVDLVAGAVADGELLTRSGSAIVGTDPASIGGSGGGDKTLYVSEPGPSEDGPDFHTAAGFTIGQINAVVVGSTPPSVTWTVRFAAARNAVGTEVIAGGTVTTSETDQEITSFTNAVIPAGRYVWLETTAQSGTVTSLSVTLTPA